MTRTLKTKRLLHLARTIETDHRDFDMSTITHDSQTPGCVAGYTLSLYDKAALADAGMLPEDDMQRARTLLHLTQQQARDLFMPGSGYSPDAPVHFHAAPHEPEHITWRDAVKTLRHLAKTGKVSWRRPRRKRHSAPA